MRKISILGLALFLSLNYSCKKSNEAKVGNIENLSEATEMADTVSSEQKMDAPQDKMSSSAAVVDKNSKRKFLKTVDSKFKVKNVVESTYKIEDLTSKFGGFVTKSDLQSTILEHDEDDISMDSTLVRTKYIVENNISIRVPNVKLDSLLRSISKEVVFLNHRNIHSDDVSLQYLQFELSKKRGKKYQNRLENAIKSKPSKLNEAVQAENALAKSVETANNELISQMNLDDEVNYSTVNFNLYQDQEITNEIIVSSGNINKHMPNIGFQVWESIKYGWYLLEGIIAIVFRVWPLILIISFAWYFWKKRKIVTTN